MRADGAGTLLMAAMVSSLLTESVLLPTLTLNLSLNPLPTLNLHLNLTPLRFGRVGEGKEEQE
jgi:hypothetical protein